ncbi:MAG: FTR1 family protein [Chloroflexi bacterium]|nr:FTR1 family protein [Chloroflexota bacterium]
MFTSFLITLREGLEAALIVSILFAYLVRMGRRDHFKSLWMGTALAVAVSLGVGAVIFWTVGELSGRAEEIFEGVAMLLAVGVLSYMVMWMKRQSRYIKRELEAKLERALEVGSSLAMASLAFIVVVREGIETALFLFGASRSATPAEILIGGLLGLAFAVAIGYSGYLGSRRLDLRLFFNITGVLLIFFAAGLLAHGIHELQEGGIFPIIKEEVWNTNPVLNERAGVGSFLRSIFGYNGNPELLEVAFYFGYLALALGLYLRPAPLLRAETPRTT